MRIKKILILLFLMIYFSNNVFAQIEQKVAKENDATPLGLFNNALASVEIGIQMGRVSELSHFIDNQIYLNLSYGITGYYSSNQAYYVLADFFKSHRIISIDFDNSLSNNSNPIAIGNCQYLNKNKHESAQIYISLKFINKKWKLTQITIN